MKDNTQFPHNETEEEDQSFKDGIELLKIKHSTMKFLKNYLI